VGTLVALLWAVVLVIAPGIAEAFRLPKLLAAQELALLSMLLLALRRGDSRSVGEAVRELARSPAPRAVAPLVAVAAAGLLFAPYRHAAWAAMPELLVGAAALVAWSRALDPATHAWLRRASVPPALVLAALGVLQAHRVFQPFALGERYGSARIEVTSLAGNPGDLGAALVLPCLVAQAMALGAVGRGRRVLAAAAALLLGYGALVSGTLAALAALGLGSAVLWLASSRRKRLLLLGAAAAAVVGLLAALVVPAVQSRVVEKLGAVRGGDWNALLTGRLDGWRGALWMLGEEPLTGVGLDGFELAYGRAKLALASEGVPFWATQTQVIFAEAHNEPLQVAAELGWPGLLVLAWAVALVVAGARRVPAEERPLIAAGLAALGLLALVWFPAHAAIVAYPALLWLACCLRPAAEPGGSPT
jgi:O-antigen ligase